MAFSRGFSAGLKDLQIEVVDQKMLLDCKPDQLKEYDIFQRMFNLGLSNSKSVTHRRGLRLLNSREKVRIHEHG